MNDAQNTEKVSVAAFEIVPSFTTPSVVYLLEIIVSYIRDWERFWTQLIIVAFVLSVVKDVRVVLTSAD